MEVGGNACVCGGGECMWGNTNVYYTCVCYTHLYYAYMCTTHPPTHIPTHPSTYTHTHTHTHRAGQAQLEALSPEQRMLGGIPEYARRLKVVHATCVDAEDVLAYMSDTIKTLGHVQRYKQVKGDGGRGVVLCGFVACAQCVGLSYVRNVNTLRCCHCTSSFCTNTEPWVTWLWVACVCFACHHPPPHTHLLTPTSPPQVGAAALLPFTFALDSIVLPGPAILTGLTGYHLYHYSKAAAGSARLKKFVDREEGTAEHAEMSVDDMDFVVDERLERYYNAPRDDEGVLLESVITELCEELGSSALEEVLQQLRRYYLRQKKKLPQYGNTG